MSHQMLNENTYSTATIGEVTGGRETTRAMGYAGVSLKTFFLLAVTIAFGAVGWQYAPEIVSSDSGIWFLLGFIVLIALTFAATSNPRLALPLGLFYAVFMGAWVGAISRVYDEALDGVVLQAFLATVAVFLVVLVLYSIRAFRVTAKFTRVVVTATFGILLLYLGAWLLSLFGVYFTFWETGNPVGIGISVVICIVAALNLALDFAQIERGVEAGAPVEMEWYSAFGLLTTIVWLYIEILRLLVRTQR